MEEHSLTQNVWKVHKFGGTSVANAECFQRVANIVEERLSIHDDNGIGNYASVANNDHLAIVVSAMGSNRGELKVTDLLLSSVTAASNRNKDEANLALSGIREKHYNCIDELFATETTTRSKLKEIIANDLSDIMDILKTVSLLKWQAHTIKELVSGYGEIWSTRILSEFLSVRSKKRFQSLGGDTLNHCFRFLDARRVITIDEHAIKDGAVCWDLSFENLKREYEVEVSKSMDPKKNAIHFVVTGYICSNINGVATTLQRDGSDYSAAIMGRLLKSSAITIWTDVDGVLSADPRRVPNSYVLPEVSFNEAMELAYFGAKVIHPKTMQPAIMGNPQIPIYIRNTFNSALGGSKIFTSSSTHAERERCVCAFSTIEKMAIVNVEGSGMVGVKGVARRLFQQLEGIDINVVLIAQASSEHSITFATTMHEADDAKRVIEEEFHKEIKQNHISEVKVVSPCSIIAAVGDGMHLTTGVAGRFFSALGDAKINVLAISQGSNERNISAVILESESTRALRVVHAAFRLSHSTVRVGIVGMNELGLSLLKLLESERNKLLRAFDINLQVCAVLKNAVSSGTLVLQTPATPDTGSLTISDYNLSTAASFQTSSNPVVQLESGGLQSFANYVFSDDYPHSVIFDCTADEVISKQHLDWLTSGLNVITANNCALSGTTKIRRAIKDVERTEKSKYKVEVTVGGALPVISIVRDLLSSGDQIRRIDGILSVTMSFVLHRIAPPPGLKECNDFDQTLTSRSYQGNQSMLDISKTKESCSFSEAVKEAMMLGLTEEDPIKDISNEYTARCLMVLAKELGLDENYDTKKIQSRCEPLISGEVRHYSEVEAELNAKMNERVATAISNGCVPRHVSSVDVETGSISINIVDVPYNHVFATTPPSCECVRFFTERHKTWPLIIQGPSAGADSTASALLAELLHLMQTKIGTRPGILSRTSTSSHLS